MYRVHCDVCTVYTVCIVCRLLTVYTACVPTGVVYTLSSYECTFVCVLLQEPNKGTVVAFSGYGYDQDNLEKLWNIDRYVRMWYVRSGRNSI